jgi:hypothetical protein
MPKTGKVLLQWCGGIQWKGHYLSAEKEIINWDIDFCIE